MNKKIEKALYEWAEEYFDQLRIIHVDDEKFVIDFLDNIGA